MEQAESRPRATVPAPRRTISFSAATTRKPPEPFTSTTTMWKELLPRSMAAIRMDGRGAARSLSSSRRAGPRRASRRDVALAVSSARGFGGPFRPWTIRGPRPLIRTIRSLRSPRHEVVTPQ